MGARLVTCVAVAVRHVGPLVASVMSVLGSSAQAQVYVDVRAGVTVTSSLVEDRIVEALTVRPALAPTLGVALGTRLTPQYAVAVAASWSRSDLNQTGGLGRRTIMPLTTWAGTVTVERAFRPGITGKAGIGFLKYQPAAEGREATLFRGDAPTVPLVGVGVNLTRPLGDRIVVGLDALYDAHRFTTAALRAVGFDAARTVHRVSIGATFRRTHGTRTP